MAMMPSAALLQLERARLQRSLYELSRESPVPPPGLPDHGPTSIRQLLTAMSTWRGTGAFLLPVGV